MPLISICVLVIVLVYILFEAREKGGYFRQVFVRIMMLILGAVLAVIFMLELANNAGRKNILFNQNPKLPISYQSS